jgi:beta-lactam-binding protein with PASTA domain
MLECPKCGYGNAPNTDFCANPDCQAFLGFDPRQPNPTGGPASAPQPMAPQPWPVQHQHPAQPSEPPPVRPVTSVQPVAVASPVEPQIHGQQTHGQRRGVRLKLEPAELSVEPGSVASATVTVRNVGTRVEGFVLALNGPAGTFGTIDRPTLSVFPDGEQQAVVRFMPARGPQHPAGRAPFQVVARSQVHSDVAAAERGSVTVLPFDQLGATLEPEVTRGRKPGRHTVTLTNQGNRPIGVQVALTDREGELTFTPRQAGGTLPLGASFGHKVLVNGPKRWFGRTQSHPFSAVVTPTGQPPAQPALGMAQPITLQGNRRQVPVLPWWIPTAALALVAIAIAVYALLPTKTVPSTGGLPRDEAVQLLTGAGYQPVVIEKPDQSIASGMTIGTDPAGGQPLKAGERVKLLISTGPCQGACPRPVPNVIALPRAEAVSTLELAGFTVKRDIQQASDHFPAGAVIATDPAPGTQAPAGAEMVLTVSTGPTPTSAVTTAPPTTSGGGGGGQPIKLPALANMSVSDAQQLLSGLGIGLTTTVKEQHTNKAPEGTVLSSTPAGGAIVAPNSAVTLTVATPTKVNLVDAAEDAAWRSGAGTLPFPGSDIDPRGFVLVRNAATLSDGSTATVLETHPQWIANGFIIGTYKLPEQIIAGDHLRVSLSLLTGAGAGDVRFRAYVGGNAVLDKSVTYNQGVIPLDVDVSAAKGATMVEIRVDAGSSAAQDWAVWKDLRVEGVVG